MGGPGAEPQARAEAPDDAPAAVCGSPRLDGPAEPPEGAVVVQADDDLPLVVSESPPGTTFWLAAGRHRLGETAYDSVRPHDGDTFSFRPVGENAVSRAGVTFQRDPGGAVTRLRIDYYDRNGLGTFVRGETPG